jgi:G3E family GTPase
MVVFDALRPGHELKYYHGTLNARMADVAIINKCDSATPEQIKQVEDNIKMLCPKATLVRADSQISLENPQMESKRQKSSCYRRRTNPYSWWYGQRRRSSYCPKVRFPCASPSKRRGSNSLRIQYSEYLYTLEMLAVTMYTYYI